LPAEKARREKARRVLGIIYGKNDLDAPIAAKELTEIEEAVHLGRQNALVFWCELV
jgi:hypothetical protein